MKRNAVLAIAIVVLAIAAVFFITKEPKDKDILAALDKTNYGANKPASGSGITGLITSVLPLLLL
jgi:hypothetical protein